MFSLFVKFIQGMRSLCLIHIKHTRIGSIIAFHISLHLRNSGFRIRPENDAQPIDISLV